MANSFANLTNQVGLLKPFLEGPIVSQFNDELPLWKHIEKGSEKFTGVYVVRPVKVLRNNGIGATSDGGLLPAIDKQTVVQAQITARYNYLRAGITAVMLKAAQNDRGAFANALSYEMSEGVKDLKFDLGRQLFYDGSGALATVSANATNSNSISVTGRTSGENGNKYIQPGMVIDIYSSAGAVVASGVGVTAVSGTTTATLTLNQNVTTTATDILVRSGSYNLEVQGLRVILDGATSTVYNISRSSYPKYQGNVLSGSNNQLTLALMRQGWNLGRQNGNAEYDAMFCDFDTERYYEKLLVADKRYVGQRVKGDGSFASKDGNYLEFGGVAVVPDQNCPSPEMYFIDSKYWKKYILGTELEWANETGSDMIAQVATDAFELRLRLWANLFPEKPSTAVRISTYAAP